MYTDSKLWKRIMLNNSNHDEEKESLRAAFATAHNNADKLADEIKRYLPEFTEHGISHLDALWKMTDVFLPEDYPLNPAEVFVLGVSFLVHDLGMGLAAYPEGVEGIQKETIWRDTVASLCKKKNLDCDFDNIDTIDKDICREAMEVTLRSLHAEKAEQLGVMSWKIQGSHGEEQLYIIESNELRDGYGEIIGRIAASHGWDIERVTNEFAAPEGAISCFPTDWTVDSFKLACIIRIADAINIDDSRATKLLRAIRKPGEYSMLHWIFQEKLSQAQLIDNRIAFSSKSAFIVAERDAWWLCYDTLKWMDVEIRKVDSAMLRSGRVPFGCVGIHSIDNISDLQKRIKVNGWQPVDTQIRATKVAHLVKTLGGRALYGDEELVPLRELVQNASDAIRARRCLEGADNGYDGTITILLGEQDGERYLEVEDNGIGMSSDTMIYTLLDFGNSFWQTEEMHAQFPGLEQTNFKATGHFGIGFFSVFMWGEHVVVTTKRYDQGYSETKVLEFIAGVDKRPFLRNANSDEYIRNGGTRIRVYLSDDVQLQEAELFVHDVEVLCPAMDCNIDLVCNGIRKRVIQENDWLTMDVRALMKRCSNINDDFITKYPEEYEYVCNSIRPVYENGKCVGRIGVCPLSYDGEIMPYGIYGCSVTLGGLRSSTIDCLAGILVGNVETANASRDQVTPEMSVGSINSWANEQALLINQSGLSTKRILVFANILCGLSHIPLDVKMAVYMNELVSVEEIAERIILQKDVEEYYIIEDEDLKDSKISDSYLSRTFICNDNSFYNFSCFSNNAQMSLFWSTSILQTKGFLEYSAVDRIIEVLAKFWNVEKKEVLQSSEFKYVSGLRRGFAGIHAYVIKKPVK